MAPQVRIINCFLPPSHSRIDPRTNIKGKQEKIPDSFSILSIVVINSLGLCLSVSLILPVTGISAELRDNRLFSERQPNALASHPQEKTPSVYDQFRSDIKGLKFQEKQSLKKRYQAKLQESPVKEQQEYYQRLVIILDEK